MNIKKLMCSKNLIVAFTTVVLSGCSLFKKDQHIDHSFGAIADCQYCQVKSKSIRKYSLSKKKLEECIAKFNRMNLEYVVHLGDFIDRGYENFDILLPIFNRLNCPKYHVLGNHDYSVADHLKKEVPAKLGMPANYYSYKVKGWRYVVLDGNDVSFHAYPKGSSEAKEAAVYYKANKVTSPRWNGALGSEQIAWLKRTLDNAEKEAENTIIFCHFPVYPKDIHNLWNAEEVVALLEKYSCVKAYINGHNHHGNYGVKNGIHYLTLKGMVDTNDNSYARISVDSEKIVVKGYGREEDRTLIIKK